MKFFSYSFRCKSRLFEIFLISLGIFCYELPSYSCFVVFHKFCYVYYVCYVCLTFFTFFSLVSFLTHQLFSSMLFNHIFVNFPVFFLQLLFSFIPSWSEKMSDMVSILLNLSYFMALHKLICQLYAKNLLNYYNLNFFN